MIRCNCNKYLSAADITSVENEHLSRPLAVSSPVTDTYAKPSRDQA